MGCKDTRASVQSELDSFLAGQAVRAQEYLGAHPEVRDNTEGYIFRVWAPHAESVGIMGTLMAGMTRTTLCFPCAAVSGRDLYRA